MKRLFLAVLSVLIVIPLTACGNVENSARYEGLDTSRFAYIGETPATGISTYLIADTSTGVLYVYAWSGYGGGICPAYNADGTLMTLDDLGDAE